MEPGNSDIIVTNIWARQHDFDFRQGQEILLSATASRPALVPTQPLMTKGHRMSWLSGLDSRFVFWRFNVRIHFFPIISISANTVTVSSFDIK
jgi:hypothetical protein